MADKISKQVDTYLDRSRKSITNWMSAYINADVRIENGRTQIPFKKPLQDIYDYAMLDSHLFGVIEQRKSRVLGEQFAIYTNGEVDNERTDQFNKKWFGKFLDAAIDSRFYGHSLVEIQPFTGKEISDVKLIPRGNVIPELGIVLKNPYQTEANYFVLGNRPDKDYYVLVHGEKDHGLLNRIVPIALCKRVTLGYWTQASEVLGIPSTILKTSNRDQIKKIHEDLTQFVHNRVIILNPDDNLEVLPTPGADPLLYKELVETCNSEMSKGIVGQTMTSDNGSSRSQSEVHERVALEIEEGDRTFITDVVNTVLFPKLIALGYDLSNSTFRFISREKRSYKEKLDTVKLLKETGYKADANSIKSFLDLPFDLEISEVDDTAVFNAFKKKVRS